MKKQLLTIAMLVSVFAAGNVLAGEDDKNTDAPKEKIVSEGKKEALGADKKENQGEDGSGQVKTSAAATGNTTKAAPKKDGFFSKVFGYAKSPFSWTWEKKTPFAVGAVVATAARLVYDNLDKIGSKKADDVEDEDDEDEEDEA